MNNLNSTALLISNYSGDNSVTNDGTVIIAGVFRLIIVQTTRVVPEGNRASLK